MLLRALCLVLVLSGPALAADPQLACTGKGAGHLGAGPVCARLALLLAGQDLRVNVEITRDEPQILAARMTLSRGQSTNSGPVVEVTATDRPLDARAADRLARGLLAATPMP